MALHQAQSAAVLFCLSLDLHPFNFVRVIFGILALGNFPRRHVVRLFLGPVVMSLISLHTLALYLPCCDVQYKKAYAMLTKTPKNAPISTLLGVRLVLSK